MKFSKIKMFLGVDQNPRWEKEGKSSPSQWTYLHPSVGDGEEINKRILKMVGKLKNFKKN